MTALLWSLGLAAVGIAGLWLAGSQKRAGWALGLAAQLLWAVYAVTTGQWGFLLSSAAYGTVYARNLARGRSPVPLRVRITVDVEDFLAKLRGAQKASTIEERIRAVHPDWTVPEVAAEAALIRGDGLS